mmetsp:Transcript_46571/g.148631  ORF Transcript_46571/g.148631 Transcript_46571/m.148631 type:complete len:455 (-) Transcript_46571:543-1907(-)
MLSQSAPAIGEGIARDAMSTTWSEELFKQLDTRARSIFGQLQQQVIEEAKQGGVPTLLLMLASLAKMQPTERTQCMTALSTAALAAPSSPPLAATPTTRSPNSSLVGSPLSTKGSRTPNNSVSGSPVLMSSPPGLEHPAALPIATPSPPGKVARAAPPGIKNPTKGSPQQVKGARSGIAHVLADLTNFSEQSRAAVVQAGGLTTLLQLVREGTADVRAQAVSAVLNLLQGNADNQAAWVEVGGIPALVVLVWDATTSMEVRGAIAKILGMLAKSSPASAATVVQTGGVGLLVRLTQDPSACSHAIFALRHVAVSSQEGKAAIVQSGGIAALVRLLQQAGDEICGFAAGLLSTLADGSPKIQAALVAEGGVLPLISLAALGSPDASRRAAAALEVLALNSAEARGLIAQAGGAQVLARLVQERECRHSAAALQHLTASAVAPPPGFGAVVAIPSC